MINRINLIINWLLVIIWMIIIFALSNLSGTESRKKSVGGIEKTISTTVEITNNIGITKKSDEQKEKISSLAKTLNYPVRKCLHVLEYLVLTLFLYNAFYKSGVRDKKLFILSLLICFLYACSDEFHQLFRERTSLFSDVMIDTFGGCIALFLIQIRNQRKLKKK